MHRRPLRSQFDWRFSSEFEEPPAASPNPPHVKPFKNITLGVGFRNALCYGCAVASPKRRRRTHGQGTRETRKEQQAQALHEGKTGEKEGEASDQEQVNGLHRLNTQRLKLTFNPSLHSLFDHLGLRTAYGVLRPKPFCPFGDTDRLQRHAPRTACPAAATRFGRLSSGKMHRPRQRHHGIPAPTSSATIGQSQQRFPDELFSVPPHETIPR